MPALASAQTGAEAETAAAIARIEKLTPAFLPSIEDAPEVAKRLNPAR